MKTNILANMKLYTKVICAVAVLLGMSVSAWGTPETYNFSSIPTTGWTTSGSSQTINSISWTYSSCTYIGSNGTRIQVGSKKNPQTSNWTIQTAVSNFGSGKKVTTVAITAYTTAVTATYDISVGGSSVKSGSLTTSSNTYTASSLNVTSGNIVITLKGSSDSQAMYLTNISVTYDDAAGCTGDQLEMSSVTATPSDGQVVLSWDAVSNATKYQVKWNGGSWTDVNTNSYTKTSLTNGTEYSYQVKAIGNGTTYCDSDPTSSASIKAGPRYTVSFDVGTGASSVASVTESDYEEGIEWPDGPASGAAADGWVFAGWAKTEISNATIAPRLYMPGDPYYPSSNETFYAVYRKLRGGKSTATFNSSDRSNLTQVSSGTTSPGWWIHTASGVEFYIESYGIYSSKFDIWKSWALIDAHTKIDNIVFTNADATTIDHIELNSAESSAGGSASITGTTTQTITCSGDVSQAFLYSPNDGDSYFTEFTVTYYNTKYQTNPTVCATAPSVGTPTLTGLSSGTISVNCPSISAEGCTISDYGFVWLSGGSDPAIGNNKNQVGTEDRSTAYDKNLSITVSAGTTYKIKAYAINEYSTTLSSTLTVVPRSVTFNLNGHGSSTPATQYVTDGGKVTDPSYSESVSGYTFLGWNTKDDGEGTDWDFSTNTVSGANVTLYAKWCKKYSVSLTSSGSVAGGTFATTETSVCSGTEVEISATPGTGYEFASWTITNDDDDDADVTSTLLASGEEDDDNADFDMPAYNITVTASFSPKVYTITYYDGGATDAIPFSGVHGNNHPTTHTYATATALVSPTKTGYTFGGWFSSKACTGDAITSLGATAYTANITLYAKWTAITYSVRFNKNDNNATGTMSNQAFTYDVAQALTSCGFAKTGCYIKGWATTSDGDVVYTNGQSVSNLSSTNSAVVDLYAVWGTYEKYVFACVDISVACAAAGKALITSRYEEDKNINVMATNPIKVTISGALSGHRVTFTNTAGLHFYKKVEGTGDDAGKYKYVEATGANSFVTPLSNQEVYVSYMPTSAGDGSIQTPTFTITCDGNSQELNSSGEYVKTRNLPSAVAIAANVGGSWHGLSANITSATTPIDTMLAVAVNGSGILTAYGPANSFAYKLWPVLTVNSENDRWGNASSKFPAKLYGDRLRFAGKDNKALRSNNTADDYKLNNYGTISGTNASFTNDERYEWKVTTREVDGQFVYTFQSDQTNNDRYLQLYNGRWGAYGTDAYGNPKGDNDLYLLPLVETSLVDMQPYEWGTDQVIVRYTPAATPVVLTGVNVGSDAAGSPSFVQINSSDLWRVSGISGLVSKPAQQLQVMITENGSAKQGLLQIPLLVNGNSTEADLRGSLTGANMSEKNKVAKNTDVVIMRGGKMTTETARGNFKDLYIYPGGKAVVSHNMTFGTIFMRGGYSFLDNKATYKYPDLCVKAGTISSDSLVYDMYVDNRMYYKFSLPRDVTLRSVTDETGSEDFPVWVKQYDGAKRASGAHVNGWEWYGDEEGQESFKAGVGYEITAKPRVSGRPLAIIRFPVKRGDITSDANDTARVAVTNYGKSAYDSGDLAANNVGWNFVGNPYLTAFKATSDTSMIIDKSYEPADVADGESWDGTYKWVSSPARFVTVPYDMMNDYHHEYVKNCTIPAFSAFFIQVVESGTFRMAGTRTEAAAPWRYSAAQKEKAEMHVDVLLRGKNEAVDAKAGLIIHDKYEGALKDFEDVEQWFVDQNEQKTYTFANGTALAYNLLNEQAATQVIPMGYIATAAGEHTYSLDESNDVSGLEHLWLTDYVSGVTTDLLVHGYSFTTEAGRFDERFAISAVFNREEVVTDIAGTGDDDWTKAIGVYHDGNTLTLRGLPENSSAYVYDMTGKLIASGQHLHNVASFNIAAQGVYNIRVVDGEKAVTLRSVLH